MGVETAWCATCGRDTVQVIQTVRTGAGRSVATRTTECSGHRDWVGGHVEYVRPDGTWPSDEPGWQPGDPG